MSNTSKISLMRIFAVFMLLICMLPVLYGCDTKEIAPAAVNPTIETQRPQVETDTVLPEESKVELEPEEKSVLMETTYFLVEIPEDMAKLLQWEETSLENSLTVSVAFAVNGSNREMYRVCFEKNQQTSNFGRMNIDGEELFVSIFTNVYEPGSFSSEEDLENYSYAMESLQYVSTAIREDSRFVLPKSTVEKTENKVSHWAFMLPEGMECVIETVSNTDSFIFYGTVNGQKYQMYKVSLGEETLSSIIGTFLVDGIEKQVSVESCEVPDMEQWSEEEILKLYVMMDSINDTIRTIKQSQGFSELHEESQ